LTVPIELEVTQFTPSYALDDEALAKKRGDEEKLKVLEAQRGKDGKWSVMFWRWAGIKTKAIWVYSGEKVDQPLELTYPFPNGRYDVYLGLHLHTKAAAVEVQLAPMAQAGAWRWISSGRGD